MNNPLIARLLPTSDRRAARQTFWMAGITAVHLLGGLAQTAVSARILGPEGYGVLAVIAAVVMLIYVLTSMQGGEAVTAFVTRAVVEGRPDEAARILRFTLAVSLGLSLAAYALIAALAFTASGLLGIDRSYTDAALLYGVAIVLLATQTEALAVLRLSNRVSLGLAATLMGVLTRIALLAAALQTGGGLLAVILAHVAGVGVAGVCLFAAAVWSAPRAGAPGLLRSFSIKVPPDVIRFQAGTFGKSTIWALILHMDSILLAQFTGAANVGMYRGARQIIDSVRTPFQPLMDGVRPEFSRQWYSGQGDALRRTALLFGLASFALAAALFGLLAVFRQPVVRLILGDDFLDAAPLLLIMIPGTFVAAGLSVLGILPVAAGRVRPSLAASAAGFVVSAAAMVWLAPRYGASGAAWAYTAHFIVMVVVLAPFAVSMLRQSRNFTPDPAACETPPA